VTYSKPEPCCTSKLILGRACRVKKLEARFQIDARGLHCVPAQLVELSPNSADRIGSTRAFNDEIEAERPR